MHMPSNKVDPAIVADLHHIALFAKMSEHDMARFAALGEPVDAEPGAVLIDQGDVGTECFFIIEGEAGIYSGGQHIAAIGAGSIVGEMALLGHRPRNASVIAQTPMRLLAFDIGHFRTLLDEMPAARDYILGLLEARAAENKGG